MYEAVEVGSRSPPGGRSPIWTVGAVTPAGWRQWGSRAQNRGKTTSGRGQRLPLEMQQTRPLAGRSEARPAAKCPSRIPAEEPEGPEGPGRYSSETRQG